MKNMMLLMLVFLSAGVACAAVGPWDADLSDFPRQAGETGDSARICRAVEAAGKGGVVWFPRGEYAIDAMLVVSNQCSLWLHKSAHLKAVKEMPFILRYFGCTMTQGGPAGGRHDHNLFIKGGDIDGNGLASCANVMGLRHFTMADTTYRNGKKVGLQLGDPSLPRAIEGGYEVIANNLYFICNLPGMAGNVGFLTYIGDAHFTDMVVVDYTVGIRDMKWSNRYTRCHVWGGPVKKAGTKDPEYLPNSIAFDLHGADAVLTDCYADTAMIGFNVCGDTRIFNCGYYNNWVFKMDNPVVFAHEGGSLIVTGGRFSKNSPNAVLYKRGEKAGRLIWRDNQPLNFTEAEMKDLNDELNKAGESDRAAENKAKLADEAWPFAILRSYGSYVDNERFTERVFAAQERHPGLFNEIWFGGDGGVDYPAEERGKLAAEKNLAVRERCRKLGIAFSYQQGVTLNHGPDGLTRAHVPEDAWAVNREGKKEYGLLCCTSPWTVDYLRETAKEILARLQPDSFWPDDDMRLSKDDWHAACLCFCDRCVKLFGESRGEAFTRETLVKALNGEPGSPSVRKAWSAFNGRNLGACTKVYREAADAVSPKTRLGIQIALSGNTVDGDSWKTMLEALAGKDGKAGTRPGGLYYTDFNPRDLPKKMILVAREAARSGDLPQTAQICYEDENWPHVGGHKNAHAMMSECAWALAVGCDSIAFYWGADQNGEDAASHDFWLESVWQWRPFHLAVRDAFVGTRLGGVAAFHGADHWATSEWANHDEDELPALVACGVPVTVTEAAPDALWLNERCVATLAEGDLANVFSRPVLMSAAAFDALAKRFPALGFVKKIGLSFPSGEKALATAKRENGYELFPSGLKSANVKAYITAKADDVKAFSTMTAEPATCGTCVVPTEFGGKVVVAQEVPGHWPHGVWPGSRRHAVLDALDFATPGGQPARLLTDGYSIAVNVRKTADGRTAGVFLFNLGLGETPPLELAIRRGASAGWTVSQPRRPSVAGEVVRTSADETVVRIPPMGAYDALLVSGTSKLGAKK